MRIKFKSKMYNTLGGISFLPGVWYEGDHFRDKVWVRGPVEIAAYDASCIGIVEYDKVKQFFEEIEDIYSIDQNGNEISEAELLAEINPFSKPVLTLIATPKKEDTYVVGVEEIFEYGKEYRLDIYDDKRTYIYHKPDKAYRLMDFQYDIFNIRFNDGSVPSDNPVQCRGKGLMFGCDYDFVLARDPEEAKEFLLIRGVQLLKNFEHSECMGEILFRLVYKLGTYNEVYYSRYMIDTKGEFHFFHEDQDLIHNSVLVDGYLENSIKVMRYSRYVK